MRQSEILEEYINNFYNWDGYTVVPLSAEDGYTVVPLSAGDRELLILRHQHLINLLEPILQSKELVEPNHNQECFGVQDLREIGKNQFIDVYFYDANLKKFVANIGDSDPYGYVDKWVSFDVLDALPAKIFTLLLHEVPEPPTPPKSRIWCDGCGEIPDGKHKSLLCKFFVWLDKFYK